MHCTKCTSYQSAALAEDKVQSPVDSSADTKAVMEPAELADPHQSTQVDTADRQRLYLTLEVGRRQLLQRPGKLASALQNLEATSTTMLFGIPPSSDHCTAVWHHGLRKYQTEATEAIQRRAIHIIYPVTTSMPYWVAMQYAELTSVSFR